MCAICKSKCHHMRNLMQMSLLCVRGNKRVSLTQFLKICGDSTPHATCTRTCVRCQGHSSAPCSARPRHTHHTRGDAAHGFFCLAAAPVQQCLFPRVEGDTDVAVRFHRKLAHSSHFRVVWRQREGESLQHAPHTHEALQHGKIFACSGK